MWGIRAQGPLTFEEGTYFSQRVDRPQAGVLPNSELHEQQWDTTEKQHDQVGNQESTWNMWKIGKWTRDKITIIDSIIKYSLNKTDFVFNKNIALL